ncbi:MAG: 6-carboxytetrahydropterin synthase [Jaaginema sp. PMC 1079.18]|nr:6-carboxytetrahydropterin synthase [Jaaginema sp. PMC 1080.18]MEC4851615.1 6-carboxytetrahydropterin synthase [Jaaginema sp. PMC 1079.18]MEC4868935.1 6-carboxytetrahydropterin synthase [Jaaginema sp. PMC 1078.18]
MTKRLTKIELNKQKMSFAAAHFTIFSERDRENLHGHNYSVFVMFEAEVGDNGMTADYNVYKNAVMANCELLDEVLLLPTKNAYLDIEETDTHIYAYFAQRTEKMQFLKRDVKLLPVRNITVEELSYWFLQQLIPLAETSHEHPIHRIEVKIFSGQGQSGSSMWSKNS